MPLKFVDPERLIHSLKTAIAVTLGFSLTRLIGFPADQWIVITILVVMCAQIYVGSVMHKSYLRFLGTLCGCLFATATLVFVGESPWAIMIALALAGFIFSYVATSQENLSYAGTLGVVTIAIILLGKSPTLSFAAARFLEISVGIMIAALISQFVLPIHARTHLRREQAATLEQLRDYYQETLITRQTELPAINHHDLDESIAKSLIRQRQLARESANEPLGSPFNSTHFMESLFCEREILRAIIFMREALLRLKPSQILALSSGALPEFHELIMRTLNILILRIHTSKKDQNIILPAMSVLQAAIQKMTAAASSEEIIYLNSFLFSAEILTNSLTRLAALYP